MPNQTDEPKTPSINTDHNSNAVGSISAGGDISGNIHIGNVGYTAEEVASQIAQIASTFQPKPFDGRCPYKGLDVFEEEDAELFFGREKLADDLVSRVKDSRTVFVTGPSGSGKSSLVRAGLIHALKQGAIKGSERWLYATMKPGRDPLESLASAFSRLKSPELGNYFRQHVDQVKVLHECAESALTDNKNQRLILFIDQFEEVFTQINNEAERVAFLNLLTHAATIENGRVVILFSMRSDFVSNCATYPQLNALLNQQFVQIGAMQPEELVSAIAQPALRVGLRIDPDLIAQIINEMKGEPGALPLMQFALKDLFDSQQEKSGVIALTLIDYLQRGGIHKALERHADDSFSKLSKNEQELARSIFSGLIEIGRGTQDTKRTALFDELVPANTKAEDIEAIVQKLAEARLITTDEQAGKDTVTISHEKLIDAWPWLKKLVNENRDVIALQNEIKSDAKEWEERKRDASYLYTGGRLINAREKLATQKLVLSGLAQEFVQVGQAQQRRSQVARIISLSAIVGIIIVGVMFFSYLTTTNSQKLADQSKKSEGTQIALASTAQANADEALRQANIARVGELSAESIALQNRNFQNSLLLSVEAYQSSATIQSRGALMDNAQAHPRLSIILDRHTSPVNIVAFSPDGKILASGSRDNTIILWDVIKRRPIGQPLTDHADYVKSLAFSPDSKTLASIGYDNTIILWDVVSHQPIGQPLKHNSFVTSAAFSPDSKMLASCSFDNTITLLDMATGQSIGEPLTGHPSFVTSMAFSPDGKMLASGSSDTIILWDVEKHEAIEQLVTRNTSTDQSSFFSSYITNLAFSPDGKLLASSSSDKGTMLWDVANRQSIGELPTGYTAYILSLAFSPDGKTLASGRADNTIVLWDVETRSPIVQPLTGHTGQVISVAFSPDGKTLASGGEDNTIILWDLPNPQSIGQPMNPSLMITSASKAISPDGKISVSRGNDGTSIVWDIAKNQSIGQPLIGDYFSFSLDGKTLAYSNIDNAIVLWDISSGKPIGQPLTGHVDYVKSIAFSPDGKTLASIGGYDTTIILWDIGSHQPIGQPFTGDTLAFSADSQTIAFGNKDNTIILWNIAKQQPISKLSAGYITPVTSLAFSPNGKILASGNENNIILWDIAKHEPVGQPLTSNIVAFSPDGETLAYSNKDTIIVWDVANRQPIGQPLIHTSNVSSLTFNPNGTTLASGSWDNIILWNLDPQSWIEKSCQRAGRNFTREEWEKYFPNEEYRKTCEQWPLEPEVTATPTP